MRKILWALGLTGTVAAGAAGCHPEQMSGSDPYDSIVTVADTLANFSTFAKFYIPDSVVHIGPGAVVDDIPHTYDTLIVNQIVLNMAARGYKRTLILDSAEVTLNPMVTLNENYDYTTGDWCTLWGWAYESWACASWIPAYPTGLAFTYSTGTLVIPMADLRAGTPPTFSPPIIWFAAINGVVDGSTSSTAATLIAESINQAFKQSPYIQKAATP
jgi:hypothetical protein